MPPRLLLLVLAALAGVAPPAAPASGQKLPDELASSLVTSALDDGWTLRAQPADQVEAARIQSLLTEGRRTVQTFFGSGFTRPVAVTVVPDRAAFTSVLKAEWGVPETECWMVATGVAEFLVVLSPRAWGTDACEHEAGDQDHLRDLLVHELVHVYHGQHNPSHDFEGMDDLGWLVEGVAVLVAGQLDRNRLASPEEALAAGALPSRLREAWSGRYRYGVSGALVEYVDRRWGRPTLVALLPLTSEAAVLGKLESTESELLETFRVWLAAGRGRRSDAP